MKCINRAVSCAIATALWGTAFGTGQATGDATGQSTEPASGQTVSASPLASSGQLQEVIVTAERRAENIQNVPISVQALTGNTLKQLNVQTFDDFIKYVPNVTQASVGPGQGYIFIRGLSNGIGAPQGTGTGGDFPNVALYLNDEPVTMPGRNLDVYAVDMQQIEVDEGPQGTLFGSGAQAGVVRYITNKPKLTETGGGLSAGYSYTAGGDPNANANGILNLALIPGKFAVRLVVYSDHQGGYITNAPSQFTRSPTDLGFASGNYLVPTDSAPLNNYNVAGSATNPLTYQGVRLGALYEINDDWSVLVEQMYQNMDAQGVFYQMPYSSQGTTFNALGQPQGSQPLAPWTVTTYEPSYNKDKFENTAWVVNGRIKDLQLVYSGAYLDHNVEQQADYTNYSRGVYGTYYQCYGLSSTSASQGKCFSPGSVWQEDDKMTHLSQELRVSVPSEWRLTGQAGLYWEEFKLYDETNFLIKSIPTCSPSISVNCYNNVQPFPSSTANDPTVRNNSTAFLDDTTRTILQKAAFVSVSYDLIPHRLTLTAGTRYYRYNEKQVGGNRSSFGCFNSSPTTYFGPCLTAFGFNLDKSNYYGAVYDGFSSRGDLSWHINDHVLVYYTWSQGFRPGGFNRGSHKVLKIGGVYQYATPTTYRPDTLINNELGLKSEFLDHHLVINGAIYQEDWKNSIVRFLDPQQGFGALAFDTNGPDYRVRGGELQFSARLLGGLTIQGSGSYNEAKQVNSPFLVNNNPASPNFGKPITSIPNVYGVVGSPLANAPKFEGALRIREEFALHSNYIGFVQGGAQYFGGSYSSVLLPNKYYMPGYGTFDASVGISKGEWTVELFGQNLGNKNASTYTSGSEYVITETALRPRIAGIRMDYSF